MTRFDQFRLVGVVVPTIIGVTLLGFAWVQKSHLNRDVDLRSQVVNEITGLETKIAAQQAMPVGRQATVADGPGEESSFHDFLRSAELTCGVKIVRWTANPRPGPPPPNPSKPVNPAIANVVPLSGLMEVAGSYKSLMAFTRSLETASRLYNLAGVSWSRPEAAGQLNGDIHLSATVTRYVTPPPPPPATPAPGTPPNP